MSDKIDDNWEISEGKVLDSRNFTEKAFFMNGEDGNLVPKKVVLFDASESEPEDYPPEFITILTDYKKGIQRGRKDPLKGLDVVVIKTDKGLNYYPLEEAKSYAARLYSLADAVLKKRASDDK